MGQRLSLKYLDRGGAEQQNKVRGLRQFLVVLKLCLSCHPSANVTLHVL